MVYKYYSPEGHNVEAFENQYFFFCNVEKLNDPFDTSISLLQSEWFRKKLNLPDNVGGIMRQYATCSFAKRKDNLFLWAHYAQSFNGFCLAFDDSTFNGMTLKYQVRFVYQEVQYVDKLINCDNLDETFQLYNSEGQLETYKLEDCLKDCKIADKFFTYLAFIKDRSTWEKEEEIRMFLGLDLLRRPHMPDGILKDEKKYKGYKVNMPENAVKALILGHNMEKETRQRLLVKAKKLNIPSYVTEAKVPFNIDIKEYSN